MGALCVGAAVLAAATPSIPDVFRPAVDSFLDEARSALPPIARHGLDPELRQAAIAAGIPAASLDRIGARVDALIEAATEAFLERAIAPDAASISDREAAHALLTERLSAELAGAERYLLQDLAEPERARLKQVLIWETGPRLLIEPRVARELGMGAAIAAMNLSANQRRAIESEMDALRKADRDGRNLAIRQQADARVLNLLTQAQRDRWQAIRGEPIWMERASW